MSRIDAIQFQKNKADANTSQTFPSKHGWLTIPEIAAKIGKILC